MNIYFIEPKLFGNPKKNETTRKIHCSNQYTPYTNFISLYYPEKYLEKDIFIVKKVTESTNSSARSYTDISFYGTLLNDEMAKRYRLDYLKETYPWEIFRDTIIDHKKYRYTQVFKSKIQNDAVYPVNDPKDMIYKLIKDFIACIFFSIPFFTFPIEGYLAYLWYLKTKERKQRIKNRHNEKNSY